MCCIFALVFCFAKPLHAVVYWGDGVFVDFGYSSGFGRTVPIEGTIGIAHSLPKASFFAAGNLNGLSAEFSASAMVEPLTVGIFSLGFKYLFHIGTPYTVPDLNYFETDNNFYAALIFRGKDTINPVKTTVAFGFDIKTSVVIFSSGTRFTLTETFPALEVQVQKRFFKNHEFFFRFATFDYVRFKLFLNTWWQVGYSYDITRRFTVAGLFQIAYADQITNSGTIDGFQVKIAAVYKLQ